MSNEAPTTNGKTQTITIDVVGAAVNEYINDDAFWHFVYTQYLIFCEVQGRYMPNKGQMYTMIERMLEHPEYHVELFAITQMALISWTKLTLMRREKDAAG